MDFDPKREVLCLLIDRVAAKRRYALPAGTTSPQIGTLLTYDYAVGGIGCVFVQRPSTSLLWGPANVLSPTLGISNLFTPDAGRLGPLPSVAIGIIAIALSSH